MKAIQIYLIACIAVLAGCNGIKRPNYMKKYMEYDSISVNYTGVYTVDTVNNIDQDFREQARKEAESIGYKGEISLIYVGQSFFQRSDGNSQIYIFRQQRIQDSTYCCH